MKDLRLEPEQFAGPGGLVARLLLGDRDAVGLFPPGIIGRADTPATLVRRQPSSLAPETFHCQEPAARERLKAALAGEGLVVTTGQQPQLFGGPLYVLYKALTAVRAAATIESELGVPCVAVFWVAGDDHDWREVASVGYLDREEKLSHLELPVPHERDGRPVGPSILPREIEDLSDEFLHALETRDVGERWLVTLREHYAPGRSFTEAFIGVASSLLRGLPIAFLDSAHPDVRRAAIPFFKEVLEGRGRVENALRRGTDAVVDLGYRAQLNHSPCAIPLFRDGAAGRYRLRTTSGPIQVDRDGRSMELPDLLAEARAEPQRFSPSAALRPALESWLLPVGATVLGPGEMAYWAQLGPLFGALEVPMPVVLPRDSWRVVEPRVARLLRKTDVSADDLRDGGAAATAGLVERSRPRSVEEALLTLEDRLEGEFETLKGTVASDLPGLRSAVGKSRSQAFSALATLRKTLDAMTRDREGAAIEQLRRAAANLYPDGIPQERAVATWVYLARHGGEFVDAAIAAALGPPAGDAVPRVDGVAGASPAE
jgi:bacillithiol biosynthesis cysteine-adding enzyme BshC